jgi:hypothetical protein
VLTNSRKFSEQRPLIDLKIEISCPLESAFASPGGILEPHLRSHSAASAKDMNGRLQKFRITSTGRLAGPFHSTLTRSGTGKSSGCCWWCTNTSSLQSSGEGSSHALNAPAATERIKHFPVSRVAHFRILLSQSCTNWQRRRSVCRQLNILYQIWQLCQPRESNTNTGYHD